MNPYQSPVPEETVEYEWHKDICWGIPIGFLGAVFLPFVFFVLLLCVWTDRTQSWGMRWLMVRLFILCSVAWVIGTYLIHFFITDSIRMWTN
jgi:hypothetical protein